MKKKLTTLLIILLSDLLCLQAQVSPSKYWYHLDPKMDKVNGISSDRAYEYLLKSKKAKMIIVAVIDNGTDVTHEDLKDNIWINQNEIPNNQIDDDKNGYVDDINGWNFIGGKNGAMVQEDNYEYVRLFRKLNPIYERLDSSFIDKDKIDEFKLYKEVKKKLNEIRSQYEMSLKVYEDMYNGIEKILKVIGTETPSMEVLLSFKPENKTDSFAMKNMINYLKQNRKLETLKSDLNGGIKSLSRILNFQLNPEYDSRSIVGDDYDNTAQRNYGNAILSDSNSSHGTHVAGIIGASRLDTNSMKGIADHVKIMVLRIVPNGDERDKDVANAIRYAVDNGAKIINMSFGKAYNYNKSAVDEAVKYAAGKDVLLVHGVGNDGDNLDKRSNYPNPLFEDKSGKAQNWIEVGASSWHKDLNRICFFSNYSKSKVDVFAPGMDIYSCITNSNYSFLSGTSMASPVVAGMAALIWSYYPNLTAVQLKTIIVKSVKKTKGKIILPGTADTKVKMKMLCRSKGIVNAYNAVKLAEKICKK